MVGGQPDSRSWMQGRGCGANRNIKTPGAWELFLGMERLQAVRREGTPYGLQLGRIRLWRAGINGRAFLSAELRGDVRSGIDMRFAGHR